MSPPIDGMTTTPVGLPLAFGAWAGCVSWALDRPDMRQAFEAETGHDLTAIANARGLGAMIDESSGRTAAVMAAWCDWVTVNVWGAA